MTIPAIKGADFDRPDLNTWLAGIPVYQGFDLMGLASDAQGIKQGYPQIMIWPATLEDTEIDPVTKIPLARNKRYGSWYSLVLPRDEDGLKATQFTWPMVNLVSDGAGGFRLPAENEMTYLNDGEYRFRIRTVDMNGVENYYPNRLNNTAGPGGSALDAKDHPNQYIQIQYIAAEIPIITVRSIAEYYNGVGDFEVALTVSCNKPIDWVRAAINEDTQAPIFMNLPASSYYSAEPAGSSGTVYNFKLDIPAAAAKEWQEGTKFLHLGARAADGKTSPAAYRSFIFDPDAPELIFDRPVLGTQKAGGKLTDGNYAIYWSGWVTGQITIGGINKDKYGIEKLYYHIGRLGDDNAADDAAREAIYNAADWTDTALDTNTPARLWSGSLYSWNYTDNFNDNISGSGNGDYKQFHRDMIEDDIDPSMNPTSVPGDKRFYLPFYVKAVDRAGNRRVAQYKLYIDPDADSPEAAISYPNDNDKVGGEVRVSGTAWDNNWVHSVQIRITDLSKPATDPDYYYRPQGSGDIFISGGITNPNSEPGWLPAKIAGNTDSTVAWFYNINGDGRLTPSGSTPRKVKIEVRAVDVETGQIDHTLPHLIGRPVIRNIEFDAGVPTISIPKIIKTGAADRDYNEGIRVSGKFKLTAVAGDDGGITAVRARISGQSTFTDLIKGGVVQGGLPAGWTAATPALQSNGRYESALSFEIDSTLSMGYGKSGLFTLELQVVDNNDVPQPYQTNGTYTLGVDNFYPSAEITTQYNAATANFYVMGTAKDYDNQSGSVQGLERVLVYFEKGGVYYNARGKRPGDPDSFYSGEWGTIPAMTSYPNVKDMALPPVSGKPYAPNVTVMQNFPVLKLRNKGGNIGDVWESPHAMVIDAQELGVAVDSDSDGTFAEMWEGRVDKEWQARLDTTLFPDGPYKVHYIVMDQAGNATHYLGDIYIGNNQPLIREFNLGTDIDGSGAITLWTNSNNPGEYMPTPWTVGTTAAGNAELSTNFTVRNYHFGITIDAVNGNGIKHYKVSYVTRNGAALNSTAMTRGAVYTINVPGNTDWIKYGAPNNNTGTTFVASGPARAINDQGAATTGTAWTYAYVSGAEKTGDFTGSSATVEFTGSPGTPGDFASIPDTLIGADTTLTHNARFIIKVYDTTVTGGNERDQLAHVALINVDIDNVDETPPTVMIDPFHWKGAGDNSLLNNDRSKGHIELEDELPAMFTSGGTGLMDRDPKVSGEISIRGTAFDNNTIGKLYFKIDGLTTGGTADPNDSTYTEAAAYSAGTWTPVDRYNTNGWKFTVTNEHHDQQGHSVKWRLDLNTAKVAGVASVDRVLRVVAKDIRSNTQNYSDKTGTNQTTALAKTARYRMDIVPYISGIETPNRTGGGLKDNNIRSAEGRYSVIQGTTGDFITVKGFNLNPTANNVRILTEALNTAYNPSAAPTGESFSPTGSIAADYTSFKMTNNSTHSGYLAVFTNSIGTLNNINNNGSVGSYVLTGSANGADEENMPNREADRYTSKNIILNDDRYLQFFTVKKTDVKNGYYPVMIMNGNNPVFGLINPAGGPVTAPDTGTAGGAGSLHAEDAQAQRIEFNYDTTARVDTEYLLKALIFDQMAMARDASGRYSHITVYNYSGGGLEYIYDRYAELWGTQGLGWAGASALVPTYTDWPTSTATGRYRSADNNNTALSFDSSTQLDRYWYPKLIAKGDSYGTTGSYFAANYLLYFDDATANKDLIFRTFQIGSSTTSRTMALHYPTTTQNDASGRPFNSYSNYADLSTDLNTAASSASKYFDMGVTSNNIVVIAYYDESAGRLKLRYSANSVDGSTTTGIVFTENTAITLPAYTGMYVSMAIDSADRIHIAAFDASDSDLKYIFIPSYNASSYEQVTVDQYGAVGNWTDIKLHPDTGEPYIAYYNATETGGRDTIKMAYAKNAITTAAHVKAGVDAGGYTTGNWEYRTVPAIDPPQGGSPKFQKVNLGFTTSTDGYRPMLGYLANYIEFSYPVGE
jgi:hypothetical protein